MSGDSLEPRQRRVLALILPDLLVELALRQRLAQLPDLHAEAHKPLGVVLVDEPENSPVQLSLNVAGLALAPEPELPASEPLAAVNREAERFGVRARQSIAEASALVSQLVVTKVKRIAVERALGGLAEVALGYGATVALSSPDTVCESWGIGSKSPFLPVRSWRERSRVGRPRHRAKRVRAGGRRSPSSRLRARRWPRQNYRSRRCRSGRTIWVTSRGSGYSPGVS